MNYRNAFEGTTDNGNDLAVALVNIVFSYTGYSNAFNVVNEVRNPIQTIRFHGFVSVFVVAILYILCNIAYFAAGKALTIFEARQRSNSVQSQRRSLLSRTRLPLPSSLPPSLVEAAP
jgi:amino acid transporter